MTKTLSKKTLIFWNISKAISGQGPPMTVGDAINHLRTILEGLPQTHQLYTRADALQQQLIAGGKRNAG